MTIGKPACDDWRAMTEDPPKARTTLRIGYVRVLVFCNSCRHQADATCRRCGCWPRRRAADRATVSLLAVPQCNTDRTDFVATSGTWCGRGEVARTTRAPEPAGAEDRRTPSWL